MKTYTEYRFKEYKEDDKAVTLRNSGGSYGGGSEVLVVSVKKRLDLCKPATKKASEINMSRKEN